MNSDRKDQLPGAIHRAGRRIVGQWSAAAFCVLALVTCARADALADYQVRSDSAFHFPLLDAELQGPTSFDVLNDGRIVGVTTVASPNGDFTGTPHVFIETGLGSRTFNVLGTLPLGSGGSWPEWGAAFLQVSPDGSRIAVSDNNGRVGLLATADLGALGPSAVTWYNTASHFPFLAKWADDDHLAFTHFAGLSALDIADTTDPAAPVIHSVVTSIDSFSSDLAIDTQGNLYTGNGFDLDEESGSSLGEIRRFTAGPWQAALDGGAPVAFDDGSSFITYSSASSLEIDNHGNMAIGGADRSPGVDRNRLGIVRINDLALREFDPDMQETEDGNNYTLVYNPVTGELYAYEPFTVFAGQGEVDNTLVHVLTSFVLGDMDGDGDLDNFDIEDFEQALTNADAYRLAHPTLLDFRYRGDITGNGVFDNFDIQAFEALLTSSGAPLGATAVPEPPAFALFALGLVGFAWCRRRTLPRLRFSGPPA